MLTLNVNGISMGNAFGKLLHEADRWKKKSNLAVLCVQEHNLKPSDEGGIRTQAVLRGYSLAISFGKTDNPDDRQAGVVNTHEQQTSIRQTNECM
jgi:exonuclease III